MSDMNNLNNLNNMTFTKENVEYFWKVLNSGQTPEDKKLADEYLRKFKEDPNAKDICIQLFDSSEVSSHFLAALVLQQILKTKINELMEKKEDFFQFRDLLLNNLLNKMRGSPNYIIERICFSVSILIAIGAVTYWPDSVEDMIEFAKCSKENCYLAMTILENINKELFELNISAKTTVRIKSLLKDKIAIIQDFIFLVMTNVGEKSENEKLNKTLFDSSLRLIHSWIKFDLNVLKIPILSQTLISYLNAENIQQISEIFSDSISSSKAAKYYSMSEVYELNEIYSNYDFLEMESIQNLVNMIKNYLYSVSSKTVKEDPEILDGLANIFSSILENFINLIFYKNSISQTLLEIFFFFISHKNRKISYKFFESVNELREFINRGYNFSNFNEEEKTEFGNFLIKISESVMLNCKLKSLNINMSHIRKTEVLTIEDFENIQDYGDDENDYGVSIADYRKSAEDIFYNIFLIFTYNFAEKGAEFFFNWINNILTSVNLSDENISNDLSRLLIVEIVIIVVKSILDTIDVNDMNSNYIINFSTLLLNSKIMSNDQMVVKFLLFLDQASPIVGKDVSILPTLFNFLLNLAKNEILQTTACYILLEITDFLKSPYLDGFRVLYDYYNQNYDSFTPLTVIYLSDCLCNLVGVLDKEMKSLIGLSEEEIVNYLNYILAPSSERIHKTYQMLTSMISNGNLPDNELVGIKSQLLKNYSVHNEVLKKAYFLSKPTLKGIFNTHMKETADITDSLYKIFGQDTSFVKELTKIYVKAFHHLAEDSEQYFDQFNEIMLNAYLGNCDNYNCLNVIKVLYSEVARSSQDKKNYISKNFFGLCELVNKNIFLMKKNRIDLIEIYANLIIKVLETVDYLVINVDVLNLIVTIFLDALKNVAEPGMNKIVIRCFNRLISEFNLIPKQASYDKLPAIVEGVLVSCDHFESSALPDFSHFLLSALNYDESLTVNTLVNVLTNSNKFKFLKKEHVDLIIKYITTIGRNEKNMKLILSDVVNISKGMGQTEAFMQYAMALAHHERKIKMENK